jgi:phage terminase large subunit-like protein
MRREMHAASFRAFCKEVEYPLERFQHTIVRAAFASERELCVLLPRGNGKTTLMAALAVHHLLTTKRPAAYVAAASREQASILFEAAREIAEHPSLRGRITIRHLELRVPGGFLRVLAADALKLHGLTPSWIALDEYHAHPDDGVYQALRTSLLKRPDARMHVISSAPEDAATPLGRLRSRALASPHVKRRGSLTEAHGGSLRLLEWAVPENVTPTPAAAKKANPASWITVEALREQHAAVSELAWLRFHCNRIAGRLHAWLAPGAWAACAGEPRFEPGERVTIGADLGGGERSTSAVAWISEPRADGRRHVGVEIFDGEASGTEAGDFVTELCERFTVQEVAADPWQANILLDALTERSITASAFPQSDARMIPASERLARAVREQRLLHDGDERLSAHVHAATARTTRRGWRLHRPGSDPIDGIVALAVALDRAESYAEQPAPQLLGWL